MALVDGLDNVAGTVSDWDEGRDLGRA